MKKITIIIFCIVFFICCSCQAETNSNNAQITSDVVYYMYNKRNKELSFSLNKSNDYHQISSFSEIYKLYGKYSYEVEIVSFKKSSRKFCPTSLYRCFNDNHIKKIVGFENIDTSHVVDFSHCFEYCNCVDKNILDSIKFDNCIDCSNMFSYCNSISSFDSSKYDFSNIIIIDNMFFRCENLTSVDFSDTNFSNVASMYSIFSLCKNLESVNFDNSDFSNCTTTAFAFEQCSSLKEISFNSSSFHNLLNMTGMFHLCKSLNTVDLSNLDLANVESCVFYSTPDPYDEEDYVGMFRYCSNLKNVYFPISFDVRLINNPYAFDNCDSLEAVYYKDGDSIELIKTFKE